MERIAQSLPCQNPSTSLQPNKCWIQEYKLEITAWKPSEGTGTKRVAAELWKTPSFLRGVEGKEAPWVTNKSGDINASFY